MAQSFKETAHLKTNINKYEENFQSIDWSSLNKKEDNMSNNETMSDIFEGSSDLKVKIKKLDANATVPKYSKAGDAGLDLTATSIDTSKAPEEYIEYGTGLSFEIPDGYVGLIFPRSSVSTKDLMLANSVGVIDSGYRGEVKFRFRTRGGAEYCIGDKIGQMIILPYPKVQLVEVDELSSSERGTGGYGSTGK